MQWVALRVLWLAVGVVVGCVLGGQSDDIHQAVRRNDLEAVKGFVATDAHLLEDMKGSQTALHEAAAYGTPEMVKLLIDLGANINAVAYNGFTPLHVARSAESVKILIEAGADPSIRDNWGKTPLQSAAGSDDIGIAEALIDAGVPVDLTTALLLHKKDLAKKIVQDDPEAAKGSGSGSDLWGNSSPLGIAAEQGDLEMVMLLVEAGADVNDGTMMPNAGGDARPLSNAVWSGHADIVRYLLDHGAAVDSVGGKYFDSIFDYAVQNSSPEILELLLAHGALTEEGEYGFAMSHSPLSFAAGQGDVAKTDMLLRYGATYFNDEDLRRALFVAAIGGHRDVVADLKQRGASIDQFAYVALGDLDATRTLIAQSPELVNSHDPILKRSLLAWACANQHRDLVQYLIERGADVNDHSTRPVTYGVLYEGTPREGFAGGGGYAKFVETPLLAAFDPEGSGGLQKPDEVILHILLEHGADANVKGWLGDTPLGRAVTIGDPALVDDLLSHGADPNGADDWGSGPLFRAVNSLELTRQLLDHNANPKATDSKGVSILDCAAQYPDSGVAKELIARGATMSLFSACILGDQAFVKSEIERDPTLVNAILPSEHDSTPLYKACEYGQVEVVRVLLDAGASMSIPRHDGFTALHMAASSGSVPTARLLVEHGALITADNYQGSALIQAAMYGRVDMVKYLLELGAPVNGFGGGQSPLAAATWRDSLDVALLLIERGADVNYRMLGSGETALHSAASNGSVRIAELLLERGADPNVRGGRGKTPLDWAKWDTGYDEDEKARKEAVAQLLIQHGGK